MNLFFLCNRVKAIKILENNEIFFLKNEISNLLNKIKNTKIFTFDELLKNIYQVLKEDGTVFVSSPNHEGVTEALKIIEALTKEFKAGEVY